MGSSASSVGKETKEEGSLQKGIAEFYDESSGLWENIWGDHMHHGFYDPNVQASISDHRSAQIQDPLKKPKSIVDVGCGIGGSSRYLARKYGAKSQGITLSPIQAERANALAVAEGLADKVSFQVADALEQPFPDGQFDLVWSMESGEHMPDKTKFVNELVRVASPGATIIIVTWCHRDLSPSENSLNPQEKELLNKICDAYYLPAWCSTSDYVKLLESLSMQDIKSADWSEYVAPFWPAVIRSALTWNGLTSLLRTGWKTIKGALAMPLMIEGFQKDLIKFAVITCRKTE
ncbi:Methyltransferase type 11 [Macleaya cordata]|uniref:Methyltransferase type 11 n=1 Tax=Macleaya cordata TaxID=56857 RepID=A0A200R6W0_MACCD|nr:Methyltransferase type 11 [Macleaya cordata]